MIVWGFLTTSTVQALALSNEQLEDLADLCARPHESFQHIENSFIDSGWNNIDLNSANPFINDLAVLQVLDRARNHYTLHFLENFSQDSANLDPNAPDAEVMRWVFEDRAALRQRFSALWEQPSSIYSPSDGSTARVRVSFTREGAPGWLQVCDIVSTQSDETTKALNEVLHDYETRPWKTRGLVTTSQYELPTHSLHPYAATPKAYANMFVLEDMIAATGVPLQADVWLQIRLSIPAPTDPALSEVPQ
ncbi:hypothetical protein [Cognatiyoonia sp. IB215182]|uniref:hypothetical protein n=1 Tax=Cognatiyoonia sp. IB215182 TaxID=3097353 RepID=UPI002A0C1030|nr:hypothetical protein [Cognatiyoonia sp. IB215182]MDX8351778.1 hypothetical protein [Cognatiyoonia sp. IB215182]